MIIYCVTNQINGKQYVGQTVKTLDIRRNEHFCQARHDGYKSVFHKAIRKYGENNFTWKMLEECDNMESLNNAEQRYISLLNTLVSNGYNLRTGGLNSRHSKETIQKMRDRQFSEEHKRKLSKAMKKYWRKIKIGESI